MKKIGYVSIVILATLLLAGCEGGGPAGETQQAQTISIPHMHGLAYSADGTALLIPAHEGMMTYKDGKFSEAPGPGHDYMGFSAAKNAFYSSGHPDPASGLPEPFGLVKSTDSGQTWQNLALSGEADFHLMTVGYETNVVYVWNPAANPAMSDRGIYYTEDDGKTWKKSALNGLNADPLSLSAHPKEPGTVLAGTINGAFISRDYGNTFVAMLPDTLLTVATFAYDGASLIAGTLDAESGAAGLIEYHLEMQHAESLGLPELAPKDVIAYIVMSPADPNSIAMATSKKNLYLTTDRGKTWQQLMKGGTMEEGVLPAGKTVNS